MWLLLRIIYNTYFWWDILQYSIIYSHSSFFIFSHQPYYSLVFCSSSQLFVQPPADQWHPRLEALPIILKSLASCGAPWALQAGGESLEVSGSQRKRKESRSKKQQECSSDPQCERWAQIYWTGIITNTNTHNIHLIGTSVWWCSMGDVLNLCLWSKQRFGYSV